MLGLYVSDHPLLGLEHVLSANTDCTIGQLLLDEERADGSSVTVGTKLVPLSSVRYLWVQSERSGYIVVPAGTRPAGAGVHAMRVAAQSSDPRPGPTAAIQIARAQRFSRAALTVRIAPVKDEQEAAATAARLA